MPGFDGTGPAGRGPETGRGLGLCKGSRLRSARFLRRRSRGVSPDDQKGAAIIRGRRMGSDARPRQD